jgi:hypothetical protein
VADQPASELTLAELARAYVVATLDAGGEQRMKKWLEAFARIDPAYADDPLRRLGGWRARRQKVDLATLLAVERAVDGLPAGDGRRGPA